MKKDNKRFLHIWTVFILVLGVFCALFLAFCEEKNEVSKAQEEQVLSELEAEDVKGVFFAMYPLESYDEEDFAFYRGIPTIMLESPLQNGRETVSFLKRALQRTQHLEAVYVGLSKDVTVKDLEDRIQQWIEEKQQWEEDLLALAKANPQIRFHIMLEYPGVSQLAELSDRERNTLFDWYRELTFLFTTGEGVDNIALFLPGAEEWLSSNPANYLDNGMPNKEAAGFALGQMICMDSYRVDAASIEAKLEELEAAIVRSREWTATDKEYTYVFFGDSVIGNYTDSMSIPGVVEGFTGARVINCGYGGMSAAKKEDADYGISGIVDAFLAGEYRTFEEDKAIKNGIVSYQEAISQINTEKLVFFFSLGLNDYMTGCALKERQSGDLYSFEGAMKSAVQKLRAAYPDCEIVLMTPNFLGLFDNGRDSINGHVLYDFVEAVRGLSVELDTGLVDVFAECGITEENQLFYLADHCHPNEYGRYEIGRLVYRYIAKADKI